MKIRANLIGQKNDKVGFLIHSDDMVYTSDFRKYKDVLLTLEIKKYKPIRTLSQNAFFHLLCTHLSREMGYGNEPEPLKTGIKERYGYKVEVLGELVPKPSHLCNKFEEMNALIEGCFLEAAEQGIDIRPFILQWETLKNEACKVKGGT